MPLMKISLSIIICILTLLAHGQETATFKVTLSSQRVDGIQLPKLLDTVFLNSTFKKTDKIYLNVSVEDTSFIIPDVPIGKYWLLFSTKSFCLSPVPMIVCSKCDNKFNLFTSLKKQGDYCNLFEMVEVSPIYVNGDKALSKDFQRTLSRAERKKLKASGDFTVHFYLTKLSAISDPSFVLSDLPHEIKDIVLKGLATVTNWIPAERNGTAAAVEFSLSKQTLLNN